MTEEKIKYLTLEESPYFPHNYIVKLDWDKLGIKYMQGSAAVLEARLMGLSFPDYCRMCRDVFGATLVGKTSLYPIIFWKKDRAVNEFMRLLNKRIEYALAFKKLVTEKQDEI